MSKYDFDIITIGAGSGGVRASRYAASKYGVRSAIVENRRVVPILHLYRWQYPSLLQKLEKLGIQKNRVFPAQQMKVGPPSSTTPIYERNYHVHECTHVATDTLGVVSEEIEPQHESIFRMESLLDLGGDFLGIPDYSIVGCLRDLIWVQRPF